MSLVVRTAVTVCLLAGSVCASHAGSNPMTQILPQNPTPSTPDAAPAVPLPVNTPAPKSRRELRAAAREARRQAAMERRGALQRRTATAAKAIPASAAVAKASPSEMSAATSRPEEAPAPTPRELGPATDSPREKAAPTLSDLVAKHASANGVPVALARAVVQIESRGNPKASHAGALGLMQIKYGTARAFGFTGVAAGLFAADTNLHYGMRVLGDAYKSSHGDVCGALMRYQSGHLARHPSAANRAYCSKARAIMAGA
ncbi:MAG: transglycosylase SLT domain-containing protein [Parafilimonas terrae]|nr:transglycosylase SLT domain-containing protein [Parafilimonas terrae]